MRYEATGPAMGRLLEPTLAPTAVTLVGASPRSAPAMVLLQNLQRNDLPFRGDIMLVNPSRSEVGGLPCWPSVAALPRPPGLVYLMVPSSQCLPTLEQLRDVPEGVVVYSAGFREVGNAAAEEALCRWASASAVPLYGPQALGIISASASFAGFCAPLPETIRAGAVGLVFQSGGLISGTLRALFQRGMGIATAISYGNGAAVGLVAAAHACLARPESRALGLYAEAVPSLGELITLAIEGQRRGKPIVLLASGSSAVGQRAAMSHTGALATSQNVLCGVAEQHGIVVVDDIDQMVWSLEALMEGDGRRPRPAKAGVISTSGGGAIVIADTASRLGLDLVQPDAATRSALAAGTDRDILNPHDTGAVALDDPHAFERQVGALAADPAFGIVALVTATGLAERDLPRHLAASARFIELVQTTGKMAMLAAPITQDMARVQRWPGVPVAAGAQEMIVKLKALGAWGEVDPEEWDASALPAATPSAAAADGEGVLLADQEARRLLQSLPVAWPDTVVADSVEAALAAAERLGFPLVVKTCCLLSHKAQVGGVLIGLAEPASLAAAVAYMLARFDRPVTISAHVQHGPEFIIGYQLDPEHGPLLLFGPGGTTIGEVQFRHVPLTPAGIDRLVARHGAAAAGLEPVIAALQALTVAHPAIRTIDINPITRAADGRLHVLDAKVYGSGAVPDARGPRS